MYLDPFDWTASDSYLLRLFIPLGIEIINYEEKVLYDKSGVYSLQRCMQIDQNCSW